MDQLIQLGRTDIRSEADNNVTSDERLETTYVSDEILHENAVNTSNDNHEGPRDASDMSDDINSYADEVILSLFYRKSKLAAAAYFVETSELHLMYDTTVSAPDFRLLSTLFLQVKPTQVVTSPSMSDPFLHKIHTLISGEETPITPTVDPPSFSNKFHFIPAKEFRFTSCKRAILELKLPSEPEHATDADRHNHIMSMINVNSPVLVSAVGGLLYFLQRSLARITLNNMQSPILSFHTLSLKNLVWVDEETIQALQIFAPIAHPSSYKWFSGASKEGLSVFSLLNRCHSAAGAKFMRVMLSQPTQDMEVLLSRHEVIKFCLKPANEQVVKTLADSIVHVKTVMKILTRMTNAQASVAQWKAFYDTIYNAVLVGEVCKAHCKDVKFFQQIADCLCDSIYIMSHCINRTMDFDASAVQKRVVVKCGISDDLDQLKDRHSSLLPMISQVAEQELQQLPDFVESCSMIYIPEAGYMLALPYWDPDLTDEQLHSLPNLEFKFKTTDVVHYKSARCYELDNMLGDEQLKVIEIESRIVLKLVQYIQRNIAPLIQLTTLVAELDCLLAFTQAARDYNLICPNLTREKQIHIKQGRHMLQEMCVDVFVPNNTDSSEEHGFVKILSGPNASGKSVYLKQVGLIVYLAHVGSFVPSENATICILEEIHTRIQTVESVAVHLSAFMLDLRKMGLSLKNSSSNSLVLIDEFGKGTSEIDGLGILSACLENFIDRKNGCPHLFVSTHFHSLPQLLPASQMVKVQHFEHIVDKGELVYLFRLKDGEIKSSFAVQVAQAQGFSKSSSERAEMILNGLRGEQELTADRNNRLTNVAAKRREFLKNLSRAVLSNDDINKWKQELVSLQL